jgi:hypothetical protein
MIYVMEENDTGWEQSEGRERIHKILHCNNSHNGVPRLQCGGRLHCEKIGDRDATIHQVLGRERTPWLFVFMTKSRSLIPPPDTNLGTQTVDRFSEEATWNIFEPLHNLLYTPTICRRD